MQVHKLHCNEYFWWNKYFISPYQYSNCLVCHLVLLSKMFLSCTSWIFLCLWDLVLKKLTCTHFSFFAFQLERVKGEWWKLPGFYYIFKVKNEKTYSCHTYFWGHWGRWKSQKLKIWIWNFVSLDIYFYFHLSLLF